MTNNAATVTASKATLYHATGFGLGYRKTEVRDLQISIGKYAQYPSAVNATFIVRGKRKPMSLVQDSHPTLVVLEGWDHGLVPEDPFLPADAAGCRVGRYASFAPEWDRDFRARLANYIHTCGARPLADYFGHDPHSPISGVRETSVRDGVETESVARAGMRTFIAGRSRAASKPVERVDVAASAPAPAVEPTSAPVAVPVEAAPAPEHTGFTVRECEITYRVRETTDPRALARVQSSAAVYEIMRPFAFNRACESLWVLVLDARARIVATHEVSRGSVSSCGSAPADIFRAAIVAGCVSIVLVHNHPTGIATPSPDDVAFTRKVSQGCKLLGLSLVDHVVIGSDGYASMSDAKMLD